MTERWKFADISALSERWAQGEITAEEYFAEVEVYARQAVREEIADMDRRRSRNARAVR